MKKIINTAKKIVRGVSIIGIMELIIKFGVYFLIAYFIKNIFTSFSLMFIISLVIRYFIIKKYDSKKEDYFGIEKVKSLAKFENEEGKIAKIVRFLLTLGKYGSSLLIPIDPVLTVLVIRPEHHQWNGFPNKLIIVLFILSNIICSIIGGSIAMGFIKIF